MKLLLMKRTIQALSVASILAAGEAWAATFDYLKQSDSEYFWGGVVRALLVGVSGIIAIWGFKRYQLRWQKTGKGRPPWMVALIVIGFVIWWSVFWYWYAVVKNYAV